MHKHKAPDRLNFGSWRLNNEALPFTTPLIMCPQYVTCHPTGSQIFVKKKIFTTLVIALNMRAVNWKRIHIDLEFKAETASLIRGYIEGELIRFPEYTHRFASEKRKPILSSYEGVSKIFWTGVAIYTAVVVARSTGPKRPNYKFRVLVRCFCTD
jgi:hypothetical protein